MAAFLLLLALAATSTHMIRRKMRERWQTLHNFSYLIALLVVIHFYWSVKSEIVEPLLYASVYVALMALRRHKLQSWVRRKHSLNK